MSDPTTIYLIRHATPDFERKDIPYHLPPGPPLTAQGRAEAVALGDFLRRQGVQRLSSSPLERTVHTAQKAAELSGIPWQIDPDLIEWQPDETSSAVRRRTSRAFDRLLDGAGALPAGLVSHGGPIGQLLVVLGMDEKDLAMVRKYDHGNPLPPAGAWQATYESGKWQLDLVFIPEVVLS
jgi:broad specificity phosphatase PhoE